MRILIIEDDPDIQKLLAFSLREACYAVDTADNGTDGLYLAQINEYDLIILDYMLPGKNGAEICRDLRASGKTLPILLLSVRAETEQKVALLTCGADDYMTKPFSLEELHARIKALLRRPAAIVPKTITVHDVAIDSHSQTVRVGKKERH